MYQLFWNLGRDRRITDANREGREARRTAESAATRVEDLEAGALGIERQLLGILRDDDLPGHEAPAAWLAYLRGQSSTNLGRVLDHNRQDVVTLAILFDRLAAAIRPPRP